MKRVLYFLSLGVCLYSCKSKETVTPNRPPNAFTVTQTLKSDGKTIVLNWTKAKDPDGDAVTYAVVLKDTLVKNISDTTFTIASLDFNYSQAGKVIAKDTKGLISEASFTAVTKVQTFVNIPDANFEKYLVEQKIDKDGLVNGRMELVDARGVKIINLQGREIRSLSGLESFIELQELYCNDNQLTSLDISKNVLLTNLTCGNNQLTSLDVSKNLKLTLLFCNNLNPFISLDVSKNVFLKSLSCSVKQIDVNSNIDLEELNCNKGQLTSLDVSKNVKLKTLSCNNNFLTSLDVSKNIILSYLDCSTNLLKSLDVSKNINLKLLFCNENSLTGLDVSKNTDLEELICVKNKIQIICVNDVEKANKYTNTPSFFGTLWNKDTTAKYEVCK